MSFKFGTTSFQQPQVQQQPSMLQQPLQQQPQHLQQQQQQAPSLDLLYSSILQCSVFGDDRDGLLGRWNLLQASWGSGKAALNQNSIIEIRPDNPLNRFKAIGYTALPSWKDEHELLSVNVKGKKPSEIDSNVFANGMQGILGNRPEIKVVIESIVAVGDGAEVTFYVKSLGAPQRASAEKILAYFYTPGPANNLKNAGLECPVRRIAFSKEQVKEYLDSPPMGVDPRLWKQAQLDNPDPNKLIPVPMIGFKSLQQRIQCQEVQAKSYQGRLDSIAEEISDLQKRHQDTLALMTETKRKQLELGHRVLHVIVRQEATRKLGFTIQPEEEKLRVQLEALYAELSAPTQFKGRLNELLSQIRLRSSQDGSGSLVLGPSEKYEMDPFLIQDVRSVLKQQQDGIHALVEMVKEDAKDLELIATSLNKEKEGGGY
ncbi:nuclear pore complex protein Nup54 [Lepeophtheirus salmonis]|uniref:nuclear pore complex protein Nup54 n=1 Tax=Lepeophtheirus salmonis TaxID=72036 RepID=UPI001AE171AB|nr:nuclear pore complex protein Nup54-like [Lepeophtheirus salmonis]